MRRFTAVILGAALAAAPPALGAPREDPALTLLQARDRQLFAIGWRLATASAPYCDRTASALGIAVLDASGFGDPAAVRSQLGLAGDIAVGAVAPGSPAAAAGIADNDTLLAVNGTPLASRFPLQKPAWQRLIDITAALDTAAAEGPVALIVAHPGAYPRPVTLTGVPACATRFEVLDSGRRASAEGTRVIFGRDFPGFDYPQPEFAAAVAHELAHNLLHHRATLDAKGRTLGNIRTSEREADRLMPWLLANAGYDPKAATRFMEHWGPAHDGGLFRNRNHEGWDERAEAIREEVAKVEALMASEGHADWARHFTRESFESK